MDYKEDVKSIVIPRKSINNFEGKNLKDLFEAIYTKEEEKKMKKILTKHLNKFVLIVKIQHLRIDYAKNTTEIDFLKNKKYSFCSFFIEVGNHF